MARNSSRSISRLSVRSSVESNITSYAQRAGLRDIPLESEGPVIIMALDASTHSSYCLWFYTKYLHKPGNKVHVCYVAQELASDNKSNISKSKLEREGSKSEVSKGKEGLETGKQDRERLEAIEEGKNAEKPSGGSCLVCLDFLKQLFTTKVNPDSKLGPSPGMLIEWERTDKANWNMLKTEVKDMFNSNDVDDWDFKRIKGEDPCTAILDYCESMEGTLIVLGSRGQGRVKRNIFGSVSEKVLHRSTVPVLVVKQPLGGYTTITRGVSAIY